MKQRLAGVTERERPGIMPLTEEEAHHHLKQTWLMMDCGVV